MSAKYLVDYVSSSGWTSPGHADIYRAGQLLADVLPKFGSGDGEIAMPDSPKADRLLADGSIDWSAMNADELRAFRAAVAQHNHNFTAWCRTPVVPFELSDSQVLLCQKALKYFCPLSPEDKAKQKEGQTRPEIPANEYTYKLFFQLGLGE